MTKRTLRARLDPSAADFNRGEPPIYGGSDPLMSAFMLGVPIMIPSRNPNDPVRLRFISWEEFKGIPAGKPCCGDPDDW